MEIMNYILTSGFCKEENQWYEMIDFVVKYNGFSYFIILKQDIIVTNINHSESKQTVPHFEREHKSMVPFHVPKSIIWYRQ